MEAIGCIVNKWCSLLTESYVIGMNLSANYSFVCRKIIQKTCAMTVASCQSTCTWFDGTSRGIALPAASATYVEDGTRLMHDNFEYFVFYTK